MCPGYACALHLLPLLCLVHCTPAEPQPSIRVRELDMRYWKAGLLHHTGSWRTWTKLQLEDSPHPPWSLPWAIAGSHEWSPSCRSQKGDKATGFSKESIASTGPHAPGFASFSWHSSQLDHLPIFVFVLFSSNLPLPPPATLLCLLKHLWSL